MADPNMEKAVAAKLSPQQQMKKTADWFARTGAQADKRQLKRLTRRYGDVTYDPAFKAYILPAGSKTSSLASRNGLPAIPTKSSQRSLA